MKLAAAAQRRGGGRSTGPDQHTCSGRPHLVALSTTAAARALQPSYSDGRHPRLATFIQRRPPPTLCNHQTAAAAADALRQSYSGGRRPRLATIIQRRPPPTPVHLAAAAQRRGGGRRTRPAHHTYGGRHLPPPCNLDDRGGRNPRLATIMQRRPPHTATAPAAPAHRRGGGHFRPAQHTGGGRPHLVTSTTAAAAAHTLPPSYSGGRRTQQQHLWLPRHASTAAVQCTCGRRTCRTPNTRAAAAPTLHPGPLRRPPSTRKIAAAAVPRQCGSRETQESAAAAPVSTSAVAAVVTRHRQPWLRRPGWSHEQARRPPLDMSQTWAVAAT